MIQFLVVGVVNFLRVWWSVMESLLWNTWLDGHHWFLIPYRWHGDTVDTVFIIWGYSEDHFLQMDEPPAIWRRELFGANRASLKNSLPLAERMPRVELRPSYCRVALWPLQTWPGATVGHCSREYVQVALDQVKKSADDIHIYIHTYILHLSIYLSIHPSYHPSLCICTSICVRFWSKLFRLETTILGQSIGQTFVPSCSWMEWNSMEWHPTHFLADYGALHWCFVG
jgi:hypothetical protein